MDSSDQKHGVLLPSPPPQGNNSNKTTQVTELQAASTPGLSAGTMKALESFPKVGERLLPLFTNQDCFLAWRITGSPAGIR